MSLKHLICPYCGRPIALDASHVLQTRWHCPYCGRQLFLLQKADDISLHGIISSEPPESAGPDETAEPDISAGVPSAVNAANIKTADIPAETKQPESQDQYEDIVEAAAEAARQRHLPRFNSLSRQVLTINPVESRIYAWRAVLTEQADGFTRNCWSSSQWLARTPNQRRQLLMQHFYGLNTALKYTEDEQDCRDLINTAAQQIARQVSEYFTEIANLRLAERKRARPFSGQYRRRDLAAAPALRLALDSLGQVIESDYGQALRQQIFTELEAEYPGLSRQLSAAFD